MKQTDPRIIAVEAFLGGLTDNSVDRMPLHPDVVLKSPLDPDHPLRGREAAVAFLESRVFPRIPVRKAEVEHHMIEGDCVATLWKATFALPGGRHRRCSDLRLLPRRGRTHQGNPSLFRSGAPERRGLSAPSYRHVERLEHRG